MSSALEYLNERRNNKQVRDAETTFGMHVAESLRAIVDDRTGEYVKFKMQELLFNARFGFQHNLSSPTTTPTPNAIGINLSSPRTTRTSAVTQDYRNMSLYNF